MLPVERVDRYELLGELATGGMGTVYLARQRGALGFSRVVAVKSMHPQLAKDPSFRAMFLDEASLTAKMRHPNVVPTLDVVESEADLLLVMEYVHGLSLGQLVSRCAAAKRTIPAAVAIAIGCDVLEGLHAAHELVDDAGRSLGVVHRDVSPANILVGALDGHARLLDFGIAKATERRYVTLGGEVRGKLAYMAPEHVRGESVDRRADVYAVGAVLWELLAGRRLFEAKSDAELAKKILRGEVEPPSLFADDLIGEGVDRVILRALSADRDERWATAREMAGALAGALAGASHDEVAALLRAVGHDELERTTQMLRADPSARPARADEAEARVTELLATHERPSAKSQKNEKGATNEEPQENEKGATRSRRALVGAIASATLVVAGLAAVSFAARPVATTTASAAPGLSAPSEVAPPAPHDPPPASSAPAASGQAPPASSPAPSTTRRSVSASTSALTSPRARAAPSVTTKTAADCTVPYTVDSDGHRHYDPSCVE